MPSMPDMADAADDNLVVHATATTRHLPGARVRQSAELVMVDSGLQADTFNLICRARLSPGAAGQAIADALDFFATTGHPFSWWVGPGSIPADLPARLEAAGLVAAESELAMGLALTGFAAPPAPAGLEISQVRTPDDLAAFAEVTAANWSPPDETVLRYYRLAEPRLLHPGSAQRLYLGRMDGDAVATAELTMGGGVGGIYNVSTRIPFRGRGIGTALTAFPLMEASAAGCPAAILQASADGVRIYQRLGFRRFGEITEFQPAKRVT